MLIFAVFTAYLEYGREKISSIKFTSGVIFNTFGVIFNTLGVIFNKARFSAKKANGQAASCSQKSSFLFVVSPQGANSESARSGLPVRRARTDSLY